MVSLLTFALASPYVATVRHAALPPWFQVADQFNDEVLVGGGRCMTVVSGQTAFSALLLADSYSHWLWTQGYRARVE